LAIRLKRQNIPAFVQSGFNEVALTPAIRSTPRHATSQNPPDSLWLRTMILWRIGGDYAAEETQATGSKRSVPGAIGPEHQHEARAGSACRQDRLDWIDGDIAPLYGENGRPGRPAS